MRGTNWYWRLISVLLPAERLPGDAAGAGGGPAMGDNGGGAPAVDVAEQLRQQAQRLEEMNQRYVQLEQQIPQLVQQRAEELFFDVVPGARGGGYEEPPTRRAPARTDDDFYRGESRGSGAGEEDGFETETSRPAADTALAQRLELLERRLAQNETQQLMQQIDSTLGVLQGRYPHMNRLAVHQFLAERGPGNVNIEKLCEISHNKELRRLEHYADQKVSEVMQRFREGKLPPQGLPPGGGPPAAAGVKITPENASRRFAEGLRSGGFGGND